MRRSRRGFPETLVKRIIMMTGEKILNAPQSELALTRKIPHQTSASPK